ncbi:unnamed protein product [Scytosiphon promiscuus]
MTPKKRKGTGNQGGGRGGTPGTALSVSPDAISIPSSSSTMEGVSDDDFESADDNSDVDFEDSPVSKRQRKRIGGQKEELTRMKKAHREELDELLSKWRNERAEVFNTRYYNILSEPELMDIVHKVPTTTEELCTIGSWRADARRANHGDSLLTLINDFLKGNDITLRGKFPWGDELQLVAFSQEPGASGGSHGHDGGGYSDEDEDEDEEQGQGPYDGYDDVNDDGVFGASAAASASSKYFQKSGHDEDGLGGGGGGGGGEIGDDILDLQL